MQKQTATSVAAFSYDCFPLGRTNLITMTHATRNAIPNMIVPPSRWRSPVGPVRRGVYGGCPGGAAYDALLTFDFTRLHSYVGVSAGAFVTAGLPTA